MKQGVFIERDGVLNQVKVERQHQLLPSTLEELQPNYAAAPLLEKLKNAGLILIATTNQPGISRGYQNRRELDRMHELLRRAFRLDDFLVSLTMKRIDVLAENQNQDCWSKLPSSGT